MAADDRERPPPPQTKTTLHDIPDKLLGLILLRIGTPVSLVRAAATCKRWSRQIVTSYFYNISIHAVAGRYHNRSSPPDGRGPVFVPSSLPAAAGEVVDGRHFSLEFLPGGGRMWEVVDSNASLLLLAKKSTAGWSTPRCRRFPDLAVCEPVTRRYTLLPRVEEMWHQRCLGAFLCGSVAAQSPMGRPTMAAFKVTCVLYEGRTCASGADVCTVRACVFDRFMIDRCRIDLNNEPGWCVKKKPAPVELVRGADSLRFLGRNARSLFWAIEDRDESLLCFGSEFGVFAGEFGIFRLPALLRGSSAVRVVPSRDCSKMTLISLQGSSFCVFEKLWRGAHEWVVRKSVELTDATRRLQAGHRSEEHSFGGDGVWEIVSAGMTSAVLASTTWLFSIDLDTMEVTKCKYKTKDEAIVLAYPCELPWPPVFRACKIAYCKRYRRYPCSHICSCY